MADFGLRFYITNSGSRCDICVDLEDLISIKDLCSTIMVTQSSMIWGFDGLTCSESLAFCLIISVDYLGNHAQLLSKHCVSIYNISVSSYRLRRCIFIVSGASPLEYFVY
ncbi:hypothetical protein MKW98_030466 [Papaver atlanticum]|uniref:Uncharacterized protein n=1 Tax=Papaver atlanticum TaxID=357466 RepID=A0AAD4SG30_9MAGN|nr:hypothetical protein MKW98_030466 [Papaver atlanticum]